MLVLIQRKVSVELRNLPKTFYFISSKNMALHILTIRFRRHLLEVSREGRVVIRKLTAKKYPIYFAPSTTTFIIPSSSETLQSAVVRSRNPLSLHYAAPTMTLIRKEIRTLTCQCISLLLVEAFL